MGFKVFSVIIALVIPFFLLTLWALVDISAKQFNTAGEKAAWWLIALVPFLGSLLYFSLGFRRGVKPPD